MIDKQFIQDIRQAHTIASVQLIPFLGHKAPKDIPEGAHVLVRLDTGALYTDVPDHIPWKNVTDYVFLKIFVC